MKLLNKQGAQVGESSRNPYEGCIILDWKSSSLKEKIGRMFNLNIPGERQEKASVQNLSPYLHFLRLKNLVQNVRHLRAVENLVL